MTIIDFFLHFTLIQADTLVTGKWIASLALLPFTFASVLPKWSNKKNSELDCLLCEINWFKILRSTFYDSYFSTSRSGRDATIKWDWNMSEVFETLRPCCKDLADASERGWRPNVTSFPLSQALHDEWPCERQLLHRFGIASLRVFVSWFLQKRVTRASFFPLSHVISEVNVIYGCQEVPRSALMPEKTLTWVGWGMEGLRNCLTHEMLWCISCVKRPWGGPILDPVAWEMKEFQRLPGPLSSRPDPRTNLFHLLFLLAGGGGRVSSSSSLSSSSEIFASVKQIASGKCGCALLLYHPSLFAI